MSMKRVMLGVAAGGLTKANSVVMPASLYTPCIYCLPVACHIVAKKGVSALFGKKKLFLLK